MLKSCNPGHYRMVRAVFLAKCEREGLEPCADSTHYEHGQFWCFAQARDEDDDLLTFSVVDSCCSMCASHSDYCTHCGSHNGISFEEI